MELIAAIGWRVVPTIHVGPISVSPHGLGIAVGYAIAGTLVARRAERLYGISRQHIWNALTWAVVGVVVGSRLFYVVGHIGDYIPADPLGIVRIWEGGLVFYGGVFGGILAAVPYLRKNGIPFWPTMDAAAPGFPLGLIFGRIGDLVIGDHLGGPTSLPWGFRYQGGGELPGCPSLPDSGISCPYFGEVVHQTALYDLVNSVLLFCIVLALGRKRQRFDGFLILFTATWYGIARFAGDFARSAQRYAGLRGTQWVSVALVATSVVVMIRRSRAPRLEPPRDDQDEDATATLAMIDEGAPVAALRRAAPHELGDASEAMIDEGAPVLGQTAPHEVPESEREP
jgi:phosphatidylglycerol:prolipoprotein diacylglycerol transferase